MSTFAKIPDHGIIIPELQVAPPGEQVSAQALLLRLHRLGWYAMTQYRFANFIDFDGDGGGISATIRFDRGPVESLVLYFLQSKRRVMKYALGQESAAGGIFVLDTLVRADQTIERPSGPIVFGLGTSAVEPRVYTKEVTGQPHTLPAAYRPYRLRPVHQAAVNVLDGLSRVPEAIESVGGYDQLVAAIDADLPDDPLLRARAANIRIERERGGVGVFGHEPPFDLPKDMIYFAQDMTGMRSCIAAYRQYMDRHKVSLPVGITPERVQELAAQRYTLRLPPPTS